MTPPSPETPSTDTPASSHMPVPQATPPESDPTYAIEFFWDPVCPFAWLTSRWVAQVAALRDYRVDWRFISLRLINGHKDYATDFPEGYDFIHTAGLRMLRVAAAVRAAQGREAMAPLVAAYGHSYWDQPKGSDIRTRLSTPEHLTEVLSAAGMDPSFAAAADDDRWDELIGAEGEMALSRTGRDVGTPIITFGVPEGLSFFGPVISRLPEAEESLRLWDAVVTLAGFPGFAEIKRSLREMPQLNYYGGTSPAPILEDWQGGHRRKD
jgi:2-hydroxychromene-2-carboxylate isomerase